MDIALLAALSASLVADEQPEIVSAAAAARPVAIRKDLLTGMGFPLFLVFEPPGRAADSPSTLIRHPAANGLL
ncbi:MAG: hypothetical protein ACKOQ4_03315 [Mycobacterium sp.]